MHLLLRHRVLIQCVSLALAVLTLLGHTDAQTVSLPIVTIQSGVPYKTQRQCVQGAINNIGYALNCPGSGGYLESCWCRLDLIPLAYSYLSSAVPKSCSNNPPDLTSAISLYSSYCRVQGTITPTTPNTYYPTTTYTANSLPTYTGNVPTYPNQGQSAFILPAFGICLAGGILALCALL